MLVNEIYSKQTDPASRMSQLCSNQLKIIAQNNSHDIDLVTCRKQLFSNQLKIIAQKYIHNIDLMTCEK